MNRFFELVIVIPVLIVLMPVYLILACIIMLTSPGNPFFVQPRVGQNRSLFPMLKFRKMAATESTNGIGVTTMHDERLTGIGKWLARFKLDELPQFINVLKGDMALVGPRPELEKFVSHYPELWDKVLQVKPGIIGYAQTYCPHEEELYPEFCSDPEAFYINRILPQKLEMELEYVERRSTWLDLKILVHVSIKFISNGIRIKLGQSMKNTGMVSIEKNESA